MAPFALSALLALAAPAQPSRDAVRSPGGAVATATISARIISQSASIGADRPPPFPDMEPRVATVTAADGSPVAALIYDFE